jgi:hypothetical protein
MLTKSLEEKHALRVDKRLATVVRIIVEQYHGDVKAFIEATRYRVKVNRKAQSSLNNERENFSTSSPSPRPTARGREL